MSQGDLKNPTMFGSFLSWQKVLNRPDAEKIAQYRDPAFRDAFQRELESRRRAHMWGQMRVLEVGRPELAGHVGRTLEEIAACQGKRPVDAYFDLGLADDLATRFQSSTFNFDPARRRAADRRRPLPGRPLRRRAHVDVICDVRLRHRPAGSLGAPDRGAEPRRRCTSCADPKPPCSAFPTAACWRRQGRRPRAVRPATVAAKASRYVNDLPCNGG
jgi:hypothetical protein